MPGPMFSCNLHVKLLFLYLRKHAKYSVFIIIVNLQNEKTNYHRNKEILALGENDFDFHTGDKGVITTSPNQLSMSVSYTY